LRAVIHAQGQTDLPPLAIPIVWQEARLQG
jgi:hypothetical protein